MPRRGLRPTKPVTASVAEQHRGVEHAQHQCRASAAHGSVRRQHVVEVGKIRETRPWSPAWRGARARRVPRRTAARRSSVLATGSSSAAGRTSLSLGWSAAESSMFGAPICTGELQPLLDGEIRVGIAPLAGSQLLQRGRQYAELHRPRREARALRFAGTILLHRHAVLLIRPQRSGAAAGGGRADIYASFSLRNDAANSTNTTAANAAGYSQIARQSCRPPTA